MHSIPKEFRAPNSVLSVEIHTSYVKTQVIRPIAEFAAGEQMLEDSGAQNRSVLNVHEDSSTESPTQLPAAVELCNRSTDEIIKRGRLIQASSLMYVVLMAAIFAHAADDKFDRPYIKFGAGVMFCEKFKRGDIYNGKRPRLGKVLSLGVGHKITESLGADLDFFYGEVNYKSINIKQDNNMIGILGTGYYDIATYKTATPYIAIGVGFVRKHNGFLVNANTFSRKVYPGKYKVDFTWNVGAGIKFDIDKDYMFDLNYKFANLGKIKVGTAISDYGSVFTGTKQKIQAHQLWLGILYKL